MLIACESCRRQYDVAHLEAGEKLRCLCGELTTVPEQRSHVAHVHHCSCCGAQIEDGATRCNYCGGSISLEERNLGATCPECFARLMKNAGYCMECGVGIEPTAIQAKRLDSLCPRCEGELVECTVPQGQYTECRSCGGLWLEQSFFDKVIDAKDLAPLGKGSSGGGKDQQEPERHEMRYLKCPACSEMMHRKNFGGCSGVIIDWCKPHGYWFDNHELQKIIRFVSEGGLDKARELELSRAKHELRRTQDMTQQAARHGGTAYLGSGGRDFGSGTDFQLDGALGLIASGLMRLFGK